MMEKSISIFYSYAHEDERLRKKLETHLTLLHQQGLITAWHDRNISAGTEWANEIHTHLNTAQIILLLVSPSFLASKYCYSTEMIRAMERHNAGEACVIPIILRPVDWQKSPFGKLQALPTNAKPITTWGNQDKAFFDVAVGIRQVIEKRMDRLNEPDVVVSLRTEKTQHVTCYVAIPFEGYEVVLEALRTVLEDKPYFWQVIHADQEYLNPTIYGNVFKHIARAHCYIAEISELDFNVGLELGIMQQFYDRPKVFLRHEQAKPFLTNMPGAYLSYPALQGLRKGDLVAHFQEQLAKVSELKTIHGKLHYLSPIVLHNFGLDLRWAEMLAREFVTAEAFIKGDPKVLAKNPNLRRTTKALIEELQAFVRTEYDLPRNKPTV